MLAAEVTVAGVLATSRGGLSEQRAATLLAMFCVFAAGFAWSWVRPPRLQPPYPYALATEACAIWCACAKRSYRCTSFLRMHHTTLRCKSPARPEST